MKTCNHIFTGTLKFTEFLEDNQIDASARMLVRIHTTVHSRTDMEQFLAQLREMLPNAVMIGCSCMAVIINGSYLKDACMISITVPKVPEQFEIASTYVPCFSDGKSIKGSALALQVIRSLDLCNKKGQLLVFLPQSYFQSSGFAETIDRMCPDIRIIGGIANDPQIQISHKGEIADVDFTFTEECCAPGMLAAAVISSPDMRCFESYALGMEKISEFGKVTQSRDNLLLEASGKTPYEWLMELGGENVDKANMEVIRIFPLVRRNRENCAWPMAFFGGEAMQDAVMIMDDFEDDEEVALGYISPTNVVDEVVRMYRNLKQQPAETFFVYSCSLRSEMLQNCSAWEMEPLQGTNAAGAFLGGEFFYDGSHNRFGNCTFVVSALAMSEHVTPLNTQNLGNTHNLYHDNEHLIDFLTMSAGKLSDEKPFIYQEMKSRLYTDEEHKLGRISKLFYDIQVHKINKVCMISARNCSEMIAYAGYRSYDKLTWEVLIKMKAFLKEYKCWYYMSDQGELMISASDNISAEEFEKLMRELYEHLSKEEYYRILPIYDFCLVMNETNLLRNAKVVQSVLRERSDLHFLVYSPDMGMEESSVHDVEMVHVITDAIAHDRVLPFYQGIYDNGEQRITMFEALMRLCDADGKLYFPNDFIPVAKKYGLYGQLSRQMIGKVMDTFEEMDVLVTMNLSMKDILDDSMTEMIYNNMKNSRHPENYVFEVVESEDVNDYDALTAFAEKIHFYGGKLALDDFGSGFSNLIHVIRLDLDYLKVDGGIIRKICEDPDCCQLLELVAMWCKMHGKKVIAEFVENDAIQKILCEYQVDYSQGYLFSRPNKLILFEAE